MPPGTRVALYKSPWPEREGCEGTIVGPPPGLPLTYPWSGLAGWEVVVRLDHDPLSGNYTDQGWSCVISRRNLTLL